MSRRIGYGRVSTDSAAAHVLARLRALGCTTVVLDRGSRTDPQPEWTRLRSALRAGDLLLIATLPAEAPDFARAETELAAVAARGVSVQVLPGARPAARNSRPSPPSALPGPALEAGPAPGPNLPSPAPAPPLSAGQIMRTYRPRRPARPPLQA